MKRLVLQELVFTERKYKSRNKRGIYLYLNASTIFCDRLVFYTDSPLPIHLARDILFQEEKYYKSINRSLSQI